MPTGIYFFLGGGKARIFFDLMGEDPESELRKFWSHELGTTLSKTKDIEYSSWKEADQIFQKILFILNSGNAPRIPN
ncbi:hypothetical protein GW765_00745 [Candidatus Parcubacteria bacterium]|nr:hypothetical protein [Candidatus Parcubacteria bacterium]